MRSREIGGELDNCLHLPSTPLAPQATASSLQLGAEPLLSNTSILNHLVEAFSRHQHVLLSVLNTVTLCWIALLIEQTDALSDALS